jgi:hypothetical protein
MIFFSRPEGHKESSDDSKRRQDETVRVFPGTLVPHRRMQFLDRPNEFFTFTTEWIATESSRAVEVLDVCALLLKLYQDLEKTSPMVYQSYHQNLTSTSRCIRLPSELLKDAFLTTKEVYRNTKFVAFQKDTNRP